MSRSVTRSLLLLGFFTSVAFSGNDKFERKQFSQPANNRPAEIRDVGLDQKLNSFVPLHTPFINEQGQTIQLASLFRGKPVILTLNYYQCPMLCSLELTGLLKSLRALSLTAGKDFDIVTISFDANETAALADAKCKEYVARYNRPEGYNGWHFLTGSPESIKQIADSVGFGFKYLPAKKEYSHPAAIMVLTPQGRIARYLLGIEFSAKDLKFALMDASQGKIGNRVEQAILYCFHYDPASGKYTLAVLNLIRLSSLLTFAALIVFIVVMFRRDLLVST